MRVIERPVKIRPLSMERASTWAYAAGPRTGCFTTRAASPAPTPPAAGVL